MTVSVKGTPQKTTTDANGNFRLTAPANAILLFSYVGYNSYEISIGSQSHITVKLVASSESLNEVVIVSYGTQNRKAVTGAVSQLNVNEVKDMPVANIGQKMQGKMAGVQINNNSGAPGANMSFRIRGAASIKAGNSPLLVIDGFPSTSGLDAISPNEIETISVLKDASSSS